jgi:uncharacterized protein (DUF1778 family)
MEQNKDDFIGVKIEPDKKKLLETEAKKNKVTLSRFLRHIVEEYFKGVKK